MKSLFIIFALVTVALSSHLEDPNNLMNKIIGKLATQIPQMKNNLQVNPQIKADGIRQIVGRGFTSFKQNAEIALYNQVDMNDLSGFLGFLKENVQLPAKYEKTFIDELSLIGYSDMNEIVESNIVFSVGKGGACKFICIMGQVNQDGTTNWLVADIQTEFSLAPNIIVIQQKKRKILGFSSAKWKVVQEQKTLTPEQLDVLFIFFEITAFERFAEVLKISSHLK